MKNNTSLLLVMGVMPLLFGCSSAEERRNAAIDMFQSASGTLTDVKGQVDSMVNMGKSVTEGVGDMVEDAQKRMNQVQSGVNLLLEGKEMIDAGVSGE